MGIILAILLFGFIVFFHELGHFLLARLNKIDVYEFWLGMGPTIFHKQIGDTDYCLKALPLGGACVMGEDDEEAAQSPNNFNQKSVWRRMSVVFAGPGFNFLLAFILSAVFVAWVGVDAPYIGTVGEGTPAQEAGLQGGDKIISMNGKRIHLFRDISLYNMIHEGEEISIVYERGGEKVRASVTPVMTESGYPMIGITGCGYIKVPAFEVLSYGVFEVKYWIGSTIEGLKSLALRKVGVEELSGPVGVVSIVNDTYEQTVTYGWDIMVLNMLRLAILLTANLGVMNLLPLPALDGGRLVFQIVEVITRRRVPPEKEGYVHMIGMLLLLALMAVVMFNDIRKLF